VDKKPGEKTPSREDKEPISEKPTKPKIPPDLIDKEPIDVGFGISIHIIRYLDYLRQKIYNYISENNEHYSLFCYRKVLPKAKKEFDPIDHLSNIMGASVGGSREAVDRGWLPFTRQIGQTGKTVSPRCLLTLGISGAIQFLKGIEDAQFIIAVNTDKDAPIFSVADLKILGDLHEIVMALNRHIEQLRSSQLEHQPK